MPSLERGIGRMPDAHFRLSTTQDWNISAARRDVALLSVICTVGRDG